MRDASCTGLPFLSNFVINDALENLPYGGAIAAVICRKIFGQIQTGPF